MRALAAAIAVATGLALPAPAGAWVTAYGTRRSENNYVDFVGPAVAVDGSGDVYVRSVDNEPDFIVVQLDGATGRRRWRSDLGGPGGTFAIALDQAGDVLAGGGSYGAGRVVKLDGPTGVVKWVMSSSLLPDDVATDAAGDVLAAGNDDGFAFEVVKLDGTTGASQWEYALGMFGEARSVLADAAGDVIAGGEIQNNPPGDAVVVKLAGATGAEIWRYTANVDPMGGNYSTVARVALDGSGDVIVAGWGLVDAFGASFLLAKVSGSDGSEIWRLPNGTDNGLGAIVVDGAGDIYAAGGFMPEVVKYAGADGSELWHTSMPGIVDGTTRTIEQLAIDQLGNVLALSTSGQVSSFDATTGTMLWSQRPLFTPGEPFAGFGVVPETDGSVAIVGLGETSDGGESLATRFALGLTGKQLRLTDRAGDPGARTLRVQSRDPFVQAAADAADATAPTTAGAVLELRNPTSGETATITLPADHWTARPSATVPGTFRYTYHDNAGAIGPCRSATLESGKKLDVKCSGAGIAFSLDEPSQGSIAVKLTTGAFRHCMLFGGTVVADRSTSGGPGMFKAQSAAAPSACP
jgi:outer membrane protein assembly factor BamB